MRCESKRLTSDGGAMVLVGERSVAMVIMALFVVLLSGSLPPQQPTDALSTELTGVNTPTLLQQLASFAAMREVAEEEELDWGAPSALSRHKTCELRVQQEENGDTSAAAFTESVSASSSLPLECGAGSVTSSTSSSSRRRPHRRRRRVHKGEIVQEDDGATPQTLHSVARSQSGGMSSSLSGTEAGSTMACAAIATVTAPIRVWSQLHVMEVALSTHDNNFVHVTQRFLEYERMYPIVYCCNMRNLHAVHEQQLLDAPATGLHASRFWSCRTCGKAHDVVREACVRCRHRSGPYAKLFFGQTLKETNCAQSVLRLLHATHPEVAVHRIEAHQQRSGRGRGCASVYVDVEVAKELKDKLHGNVFFDLDDSGCVCAHYVYSSQQPWLAALIQSRRAQRHPPNTLPCGALVVEEPTEKEQQSSRASAAAAAVKFCTTPSPSR